jgi:hypothetical protein
MPMLNTAAMPDLDAILRRAATADGWTRVIHRCAWCQRTYDQRGVTERVVAIDRTTVVVSDGMCPPCGARGLAQLAARKSRAAVAA